MTKAELVFFPWQGVGHITPMLELAKRLVQRHPRISINVCLFDDGMLRNNLESLHSDPYFVGKRIKFLELPEIQHPLKNTFGGLHHMMDDYKPVVKRVIEGQILGSDDSAGRLAGFVIDLFCTQMMDVASELRVPAYIFYASNCALLTLTLHFQHLRDDHGVDVTDLTDPETELDVPGFRNRVPRKVWPMVLLEKGSFSDRMLYHGKRYRSARGILVNTFEEVESYALRTLSEDPNIPTLYPVGPVIEQIKDIAVEIKEPIICWLDDQPPESVVFLCFGSMGSFDEDQVTEIAKALEGSGHRFLWSLRQPAGVNEKSAGPSRDYEDVSRVLPDGFIQRTAERGRVIGWAPQVKVLSHPAVGAFVSHCGWNSTLESLWYGVPVAAWPMYAEQQINAFRLVRELGISIEIQVDYRRDIRTGESTGLVKAEVIEDGINKVMDIERGELLRGKVKEMSVACRNATKEGGSSYNGLGRFIDDVFQGIEI
ncbi:hypothetical protein Dimus_014367 [Dionaea muscipula]